MLLDLARQVDLDALVLGLDLQGVVDVGQVPSSNSASNVEPITWAIRPVVVAVAMMRIPSVT